MPYIKLSEDYEPLSEGEHTFTITSVNYQESYSKVTIYFNADADDKKHSETYQVNTDGGLKAFSRLAKKLCNGVIEDIDPQDLVGAKFSALVEHTPNPDKDKAPYAHIRNITSVIRPFTPSPVVEEDDLPF